MAPGEPRVTRGSFISWPQKTADRRQKTLSLSLSLLSGSRALISRTYIVKSIPGVRVGEASGGRSVCLSVRLSVFDAALKARAGKEMEGATRRDAGIGVETVVVYEMRKKRVNDVGFEGPIRKNTWRVVETPDN